MQWTGNPPTSANLTDTVLLGQRHDFDWRRDQTRATEITDEHRTSNPSEDNRQMAGWRCKWTQALASAAIERIEFALFARRKRAAGSWFAFVKLLSLCLTARAHSRQAKGTTLSRSSPSPLSQSLTSLAILTVQRGTLDVLVLNQPSTVRTGRTDSLLTCQ